MEYQEVKTQKEYLLLLSKVMQESQLRANAYPGITLYRSIFNQLVDVRTTLKKGDFLKADDIYVRYNFGAIAVKNFEPDTDLYARELQDLFGGLFDFYRMPES